MRSAVVQKIVCVIAFGSNDAATKFAANSEMSRPSALERRVAERALRTQVFRVFLLLSVAVSVAACFHHRVAEGRYSNEPVGRETMKERIPPANIDSAKTPDQNERSTLHQFCIALDIGHLPSAPGATAADGKMEYTFNKRIVELLADSLRKDAALRAVIINPEGKRISLPRRAALAKDAGADLFLSIHHDSANDRYLERHEIDGKVYHQTDRLLGVFFG